MVSAFLLVFWLWYFFGGLVPGGLEIGGFVLLRVGFLVSVTWLLPAFLFVSFFLLTTCSLLAEHG